MTRKDYIIIAEAIRRTKYLVWDTPNHPLDGVNAVKNAVAQALLKDNPRFNYTKWEGYINE